MNSENEPRISASDEQLGDSIDRYRLVERIGQGAWGTVWLAEQSGDIERKVALKILKLGLDTKDFLRRFDSERRALGVMDHTGIAKILDTGSTEYGRPYLVMEYIDGLPLLEYANRKRLTLRDRLALFVQVCQAVGHANEKGVVHRDIKPSNILVVEQDGKSLPKIIDFGIAKTNEVRLSENTAYTNIHTFIGTPLYSSPEQLEFLGVEVDERSDVYSLGAVLYELLCGLALVDPDDLMEEGIESVRTVLLEKDPPLPSERFGCLSAEEQERIATNRSASPSEIETALEGDLDGIVSMCLEKDRERRYASAKALADDLTAALEHRPVAASRPGALTPMRKFLQRHRRERNVAIVVASFTALLAVAFFSIGERWKLSIDETERKEVFRETRLAVMPFVGAGASEGDELLGGSLQTELIVALSQADDSLSVLSQLATAPYRGSDRGDREIGRSLKAGRLLRGTVEQNATELRVRVQLIDAYAETTLWSNQYARAVGDGERSEIQSSIARSIGRDIVSLLKPGDDSLPNEIPTDNLAALQAYLEAKEIVDRDVDTRMPEALELFQQAIELDPDFALAYAGLAQVYLQRSIADYLAIPAEEIAESARQAVRRALELDNDHPQIIAQDGFRKMMDGSNDAARNAFLRALEIEPEYPDALYGLAITQMREARGTPGYRSALEDAVSAMERAIFRDPKNPYYRQQLVGVLRQLGRTSEALEHLQMAARHNPDSVDANARLGEHWANEYSRFDEAIVHLRRAHFLKPDGVGHAASIRSGYFHLNGLEEAAFWTEREMKLNREIAPAYRGNLLRFRGDVEGADRAYREAMSMYPNEISYRDGRLWTLSRDLRYGDPAEALRRYREGMPQLFEPDVTIDNGNAAELALEAAALLEKSGAWETADILLKRTRAFYESARPSAELSYRLALLNLLEGNKEAAITHFRDAIDGGLRVRRSIEDARLDPLREDPRFKESVEIFESDMAKQLQALRRRESSGELAPLPSL